MSVNKVTLLGNLGSDPKVNRTDAGVAVAMISLATSEKGYTTKDGTQVPERVEWHSLVLWRGLAEVAEKYLHKGDKIYVEGKQRTRLYEDQQGIKRWITEVYVDVMEMLGTPQRKPMPEEFPSVVAPSCQNSAGAKDMHSATMKAQSYTHQEPGFQNDLPWND